MGRLRRRHLVLLQMVRFGLRHPRLWAAFPIILLAAGVLGLGKLSNHYAWGGGTTLLIGLLALSLFVVTVGPLSLLPRTFARQARGEGTSTAPMLDLMVALKQAAHEVTALREPKESVSTPSKRRRGTP